jgi:hypothetical protein
MSCPDIHSLIDVLVDERPDPEMVAHMNTCPSCQGYAEILREIPAAFHPEEEVPDYLVQRVLAEIPPEGLSPAKEPEIGLQALGSGVLGGLTAAAAILATGSSDGGGPATILLISAVVGLIASMIQLRLPEDWDAARQDRDPRQAT